MNDGSTNSYQTSKDPENSNMQTKRRTAKFVYCLCEKPTLLITALRKEVHFNMKQNHYHVNVLSTMVLWKKAKFAYSDCKITAYVKWSLCRVFSNPA